MANEFFRKILFVDLSQGRIEERPLPPAIYRDCLSGYGLGARLLHEWMPPGGDPLGVENVRTFVPELLIGTGVPFSGRFMVVGKSPLRGKGSRFRRHGQRSAVNGGRAADIPGR